MNTTKDQLARALAEAVLHESRKAVFMNERMRGCYLSPLWFQPAAWALVDYAIEAEEANRPQIPY